MCGIMTQDEVLHLDLYIQSPPRASLNNNEQSY